MKKLLSLMTVAMLSVVAAFAGNVTITMADYADQFSGEATSLIDATDVKLLFEKQSGSTNPTINSTSLDARLYAKGTLTVTCTENMTSMVFNLSNQGLKRAAEITPSVGECVVDVEAKTVTWTGSAKEVVLTVGEKAVYGSDGESKAGQFDFLSIDLVVDGEITVGPGEKPIAEPFSFDNFEYNYAQGLYLTNYYSEILGGIDAWAVELVNYIDDDNYDTYFSFAFMTESATTIAGTYDIGEMLYSTVDLVDGTDTTTISFVSGTATISRRADEGGLYVYHITFNAQDEDGNEYSFEDDVVFDYCWDPDTDEDIVMTDPISTGLSIVKANNLVSVVNGQLMFNVEGQAQIYNVAGQMLYNGFVGKQTIVNNIEQGQMIIVRVGNKAAKVVL